MLETYFEEIERKRRGRRIFWLSVFVLATFLYLFFQGYYPYVRIDFPKFFERDALETVEKPQVVRAFGIINVRTSPAADKISVRGAKIPEKAFANDDKGFFDFGKYAVGIEKTGYVPVSLDVILNKQNAFSINVLNLLKNPTYSKFSIPTDRIDPLESGNFLVREKNDIRKPGAESPSGRIYRLLWRDLTPLSGSGLRTDARPIGGGYFEKAGIPLLFDTESRTLKPVPRVLSGTGSGPCFDADFEWDRIRCPKTGTTIPLRTIGLKERFLGFGGRIVRTEKETRRMENEYLVAVEAVLTASGGKAGNPFRLAGKTYRLNAGIASAENAEHGTIVIPLDSVASVHEFGNESILFGYVWNDAAFVLADERWNLFPGKIPNAKLSEISVEPFLWAYVFRTEKSAYLYYRGSTQLTKLLEADKIFALANGAAVFEKASSTYRLELEMGEKQK